MSLVHRFFGKLGYLLRLRLTEEPGPVWRGAVWLLAQLIRLLALTLRYRLDDQAGYLTGNVSGAVAMLLWHNRIFAAPVVFERYCRPRRRAFVLTSASREGSLLALLLRRFRIAAVRGSTSRRASIAVREMAGRIAAGEDAVITPDGPRGPRYRLQPGALFLAQKDRLPAHSGAHRVLAIRPVQELGWVCHSAAVCARACHVRAAAPHQRDLSAEEFEAERLRLERRMTDGLLMD
jgi:lysophospholipid acyltransferase (LPLAT)-like uncharacterized protein